MVKNYFSLSIYLCLFFINQCILKLKNFMDLPGVEPGTRQCECRVIPLYYRPVNFFNLIYFRDTGICTQNHTHPKRVCYCYTMSRLVINLNNPIFFLYHFVSFGFYQFSFLFCFFSQILNFFF